jgi:hypothetical protein
LGRQRARPALRGIEPAPLGIVHRCVEQCEQRRQERFEAAVEVEQLAGDLLADASAIVAILDPEVALEQVDDRSPIETERLAREEYRRRYDQEYYLSGNRLTIEMLAAAIDQAQSIDPLRVAYALEGLHLQGNIGEVWMRPDDHQLLEPLFVVSLTRINGRDVKYGLEGTQTGTRTLARIEAAGTAVPTRCEMTRPPRP